MRTTINQIASKLLNIETLETRYSDQLDFHDCSVWSIKEALEDAYQAGIASTIVKEEPKLTFTRFTDWNKMNGSCNQGMVETTYDKLVELFGEPERTDCGKTQVEWDIEWSDGTITTIYDWKWYDTEPEEVPEWSIGGFNYKAALYVQELLAK